MKISVYHWKYLDGYNHTAFEPVTEAVVDVIGWHCWVYTDNNFEFEKWMKEFCPKSEYTLRFNSGDPVYILHITDQDEAAHFLLKWKIE